MPVTPATKEAEAEGLQFQRQPGQLSKTSKEKSNNN